jgi:hypothetical protein
MLRLNQIELALAGRCSGVAVIIDAAPRVHDGARAEDLYSHAAAWLFPSQVVAGVRVGCLFGKKKDADGWVLAAAELAVVFGIITL